MSDVWEKRRREGDRAYAAFVVYRNLGTQRSLSKVAQLVSKSVPLMKRWCARYHWARRAQAWDAHLCRIDEDTRRQVVKDACERHVLIAKAMQARLGAQLQHLQECEKGGELKPMGYSTIAQWLDISVKVERLGLGMPTANVAHGDKDGGPVQLQVTMNEARRRLRDKLRPIAQEAAAAQSPPVGVLESAEPEPEDIPTEPDPTKGAPP